MASRSTTLNSSPILGEGIMNNNGDNLPIYNRKFFSYSRKGIFLGTTLLVTVLLLTFSLYLYVGNNHLNIFKKDKSPNNLFKQSVDNNSENLVMNPCLSNGGDVELKCKILIKFRTNIVKESVLDTQAEIMKILLEEGLNPADIQILYETKKDTPMAIINTSDNQENDLGNKLINNKAIETFSRLNFDNPPQ